MADVAGGSTGVAVGQFLTVVGEDGALFVWGSGLRGQLGTGTSRGDADDRHAPTLIAELPAPTRQIAAGVSHTSIVTDSCDLLMRGCGVNGRLGLGDDGDRNAPTLVALALFDGTAVLMVACGQWRTAALTEGGGVYTFGCGRHTVALIEEGHVYTSGEGEFGQLGHNDREHHFAPRQVEPGRFGGERVVFVAAGRLQTVAVTTAGRLCTWGAGADGRLGHGDTRGRLLPTQVGAGAFRGLAVVMAACGLGHTLVMTHNGALWACGCGLHGRLGLNDDVCVVDLIRRVPVWNSKV